MSDPNAISDRLSNPSHPARLELEDVSTMIYFVFASILGTRLMPRHTLEAIEKRISALLSAAKRLKKRKAPALRRIVGLARTHGISMGDIRDALFGERKKRSAPPKKKRGITRKVAPMYRNPKTGETWSGRGRPARWVAAAEKQGRKRTE